MATEQEILDYAHVLMGHTRVSLAYLETYKCLRSHHVKYRESMLNAVVFFNIIEKSLISALMIELCKLFEDDRKVMSVYKLYNICEQNQKIFHGKTYIMRIEEDDLPIPVRIDLLLNSVKKELEDHENAIQNLKALRDQIWAHSDKKHFLSPDKLEEEYPVDIYEIESLLHIAWDFPNTISYYLTEVCETPWFNSSDKCNKDVKNIMKWIQLGIETEKINAQTEI